MSRGVRPGPLARTAPAWLGLAALACVSTATHERVVADLEERMAAERASFDAERARLLAEDESLRAERDELARRLSSREQELGEKTEKLDEIHPTYEGLVRDLEGDLAAARIELDRVREGLRMSLPAETLFASGSADLTGEGERVLGELAASLRGAPYQVLVQGHTDGVAIRGALARRFATNWELAAARAARVVRVLEAGGVDPTRLAAVSLGQHHPVASDDTDAGRTENRRIEIRLVPLPGAPPDAPAPPGFAPAEAAPAAR
jgi:chemotaxis protein MotB